MMPQSLPNPVPNPVPDPETPASLALTLRPRAIAWLLSGITIVLGLASTAVQIGKYVYGYRADWTRAINLDREMNIPTVYSGLLLLSCALLLHGIAQQKQQTGDRFARRWRWLSRIFVFLALDEVLSIHEILIIPEVAEALRLPSFLQQVWVIPAAVFVVWLGYLYWPFWRQLPRRTRRDTAIAAALYVGGALGFEMIGGAYADWDGQQNLTYALLATVEELLEMFGLIVFLLALLGYLATWRSQFWVSVTIASERTAPKRGGR